MGSRESVYRENPVIEQEFTKKNRFQKAYLSPKVLKAPQKLLQRISHFLPLMPSFPLPLI